MQSRYSVVAAGVGVLSLALPAFGAIICPNWDQTAPRANFVAHVEHRGLVIDEMDGGQAGVVVPAGSLPFSGGPAFVLRVDDTTAAALWSEPSKLTVRETSDESSPTIGQIDAGWEDGTLWLTVWPVHNLRYSIDAFRRVGADRAPHAVGPPAATLLDVRGTYRATVRDLSGTPVGWLRVRISPYQSARRIYDGFLPSPTNGVLAAAIVERLDREIDWVEDHALNPYVGN